ncbi:hypothetical protein ACFL3A_00235 [Pseudomonadota bacterium]
MAELAMQLPWSFYLQFFGWLALLLSLFLIVRKKKFWGRSVIYTALGVLVLRLFLFENPFSWTVYGYLLKLNDLGYWNRAILSRERSRYMGHPENVQYLAVGTSQVGAMFDEYARVNDANRLVVFSLPGMKPISYVLYREHIASYKPQNVILYLSEFDLGRAPNYGQWKMAPSQGLYTWKLYSLVKEGLGDEPLGPEFTQMVVGNWFPEYKYNFVFRSLLDKTLSMREAVSEKKLSDIPDSDFLAESLEGFKTLSDKYIGYHLRFLEEFIRFCKEKQINVVILEGDYHPLGYSEKNLALNKIVRQALITLANDNSHVRFVPRKAAYEVTAEDFRDGTHVKRLASLEFTKRLLNHLEGSSDQAQDQAVVHSVRGSQGSSDRGFQLRGEDGDGCGTAQCPP